MNITYSFFAGRDATQDFDDVGHSEEAHKLMKDFLIGELEVMHKT